MPGWAPLGATCVAHGRQPLIVFGEVTIASSPTVGPAGVATLNSGATFRAEGGIGPTGSLEISGSFGLTAIGTNRPSGAYTTNQGISIAATVSVAADGNLLWDDAPAGPEGLWRDPEEGNGGGS